MSIYYPPRFVYELYQTQPECACRLKLLLDKQTEIGDIRYQWLKYEKEIKF